MYGDYRSDAILNDKAIEMPRITFVYTDYEDEKKIIILLFKSWIF